MTAKLAFQRMDLERKWSAYFKKAERQLQEAEAIMTELKQQRENNLRLQK